MASRYYGLNRGQTEFSVTEDSSTTSKGVEVVINLAVGLKRSEILDLLEQIKNHILKGLYPPA